MESSHLMLPEYLMGWAHPFNILSLAFIYRVKYLKYLPFLAWLYLNTGVKYTN